MLASSLLLSDGATVLDGQRQSQLHDQFIDGRGCYYLHLSTLDTAVTVEELGLQVEWQRPKTVARRSASTTSTLAWNCHVKESSQLVTRRWRI
eukprot:1573984-Amphidinium_carterae.1